MTPFDKSRYSDPLPRLKAMAAKPKNRERLRLMLSDPDLKPEFRLKVVEALAPWDGRN